MLKLIAFSVLLAFAAGNNLDQFKDFEWRAIKLFADKPVVQECEPMKIIPLNQFAKCGSDARTQVAKLQVGKKFITWPVLFVSNSHEEVLSSLQTKCTWDDKIVGHFVFRVINENYFLMYFDDPGLKFGVLVGKTVPSEAEVDSFIKTLDWAKDQTSYSICTTEIMNGSAKKVTSGLKWWEHKATPNYSRN